MIPNAFEPNNINYFNKRHEDKYFAIKEEDWPTSNKEKRPIVIIRLSDDDRIMMGQALTFGDANALMAGLEKEIQNEKAYSTEYVPYCKTRYSVLIPCENKITIFTPDRYDIGYGDFSSPMDQLNKDFRLQSQYPELAELLTKDIEKTSAEQEKIKAALRKRKNLKHATDFER
ncbi:LPD25 domain-containing protein [Paenibacillus larvae]|uniref:Large polyvalent protein associated domain-containing protein n=1 Tax=Paenibacillus larvae subsp. larvae TaxID=147375 RepID=A0A2L1U7K3_9BACL|nr:LPD25 domain-containing protein [Paenibacillus larvae]AVF28848.1 hypothetical protein ERICIII_04845 [Paenibacillus larvae subsp. larvae]MCY9500308.1 hypothetical protein [Paenibacillus larvae]MCY9748159.1 hypothetical protein [Paenibacillus larvae]MCY9752472.1 hypothetical protein [Paenibacillus larvae]MDR5608744.1 LPD25 domain-containing protein [Paenibacillus larvae]